MHVLAVVRGSKITGADSSFEVAGSLIRLNTRLAPDIGVGVLRTGQFDSGPTRHLRWTSRLMVDADRPKWRAIDRNEPRMLNHREISSRSKD